MRLCTGQLQNLNLLSKSRPPHYSRPWSPLFSTRQSYLPKSLILMLRESFTGSAGPAQIFCRSAEFEFQNMLTQEEGEWKSNFEICSRNRVFCSCLDIIGGSLIQSSGTWEGVSSICLLIWSSWSSSRPASMFTFLIVKQSPAFSADKLTNSLKIQKKDTKTRFLAMYKSVVKFLVTVTTHESLI